MGKNKIISYPLTSKFTYEQRYRQFDLQATTIRGMRASSQADIDNGEKEAFIDFRGYKPKAIIKVRNLIKKSPEL